MGTEYIGKKLAAASSELMASDGSLLVAGRELSVGSELVIDALARLGIARGYVTTAEEAYIRSGLEIQNAVDAAGRAAQHLEDAQINKTENSSAQTALEKIEALQTALAGHSTHLQGHTETVSEAVRLVKLTYSVVDTLSAAFKTLLEQDQLPRSQQLAESSRIALTDYRQSRTT